MDPKTLVHLLVCVWYSLSANKSAVVTAQGMLSAEILTRESERKEGGQVQIKCNATKFDFPKHFLGWKKDSISLKRGEDTFTTDQRLMFHTTQERTTGKVYFEEVLTITGVHKDDSGTYTCNVIYNDTGTNGSNIVASVPVTLSVLYFPSESFPICSPARPITAVAGTELNLQCSSDVGNPQVIIMVFQLHNNASAFSWSAVSRDGATILRSLDLTAHITNNNIQFICIVTSPLFPSMNRSCNIGPITVTESLITPDTTPSNNKTTAAPMPSINLTIIASTVAAGFIIIIIIIILIVLCRRRGLIKKKQPSEDNTVVTNSTSTASPRDKKVKSSQPHVYNLEGGLDKYDTESNEVDLDTNPVPELTGHHSSISWPQRSEEPDSGLIYAKPQEATVLHHSDSGVKSATEQTYTNPSFDFEINDDTSRPLKEHPKTSIKPVAIVHPNMNVPKKPAPYRPKSNRTSNTHDNPITSLSQDHTEPSPVHSNDCAPAAIQRDNHDGGKAMQEVKSNVPKKPAPYRPKSDRTSTTNDNPITSPSRDHTEPSSGHPQDGRQETSSPPSDVTCAQVSVPIMQNSRSSQGPGDDITYAELDLTSHTTQDGGVTPSPTDAAIYATVTKMK